MAHSTPFATMNDLPLELLYTVLSHRIGTILFDYLFIAPLLPTDSNDRDVDDEGDGLLFNGNGYANGLLGFPNTAVIDEWTNNRTNRVSHVRTGGGITRRSTDADRPLKEISSLGRVSVPWRIMLSRILGAILHRDNPPNHQVQSLQACIHSYHLTPPSSRRTPVTTAFPLSLGNYHVPLRSMQATLRTLLQESMDRYRIEQESMLVPGHQTGVHTPTPTTGSNTPSQMTIAIPNTTTHSIPTLLLSQPSFSTLLSSLTDDDCPFVQLPVFTEALRYTQASIFTCDDTSKMTNTLSFNGIRTTRNDLSLTLTSARILGALNMLTDSNTRLSIRPKEIAETIQFGMESVSQRLQQALQVCQWNDLLERVFLRGERSDEMLNDVHACFESMEERAGTIEMAHLLRSGLFKTVQLVSRVGVMISHGYTGGGLVDGDGEEAGGLETSSEEWKIRAGVLSFCWTGRVIGWNGV